MRSTTRLALALLLSQALATSSSSARADTAARSHRDVVGSVANMVRQAKARTLAQRSGLQILNVMWEDTGRYLGSSVGPNISDVSIEVEFENASSAKETRLMPVLRYPNFSDKTGDIDIDKFFVPVGNQAEGTKTKVISLRELLAHPLRYMSRPSKGTIKGGTLLSKRDKKVLVSAQSAFLPVRKGGKTRFWPVIFNYQSYKKHPAVLSILVTRQGVSMSIVDNSSDTGPTRRSWGQRLFFNHNGRRTPLTAERLKDVQSKGVTMNGESAESLGKDSNLLMLIQVPLKQARRPRSSQAMEQAAPSPAGYVFLGGAAVTKASGQGQGSRYHSDVDVAVLGHGRTTGPFTELKGLNIERDPRFPVRVTVQFYQATSNGVVSSADMERMSKQIAQVYKRADYVGSLVVPEKGSAKRPTLWSGAKSAALFGGSWRDFTGLRERYHRYGWAGVAYRSDMVSGAYASPPNPFAALAITSLCATVGTIFR